MTSRADVIAEARRWIGTRWSHQGRKFGVGVDCIGLCHEVARVLGLASGVNVPATYERTPSNNQILRGCDRHLIRIQRPALGCLVVMRFQGEPIHMGLIGDYPLGGFSLIHAYAKARKVEECRLDETWANRIVACYDLPGVA